MKHATMPSAKLSHPAALLFAVALATRAITFGNPIVHVDEQFYFTVAHDWVRGALPYVDIWDRKPVGLFLLYVPAALLPLRWGILAYQIMALLAVWGTAMLIVRLAARSRSAAPGADAGALLAGIGYLVWIILAEGQGGQSPVFYNLLTALAATLVIGPDDTSAERDRPRLVHQAAAMLLIGLAIEINPLTAFEGCFFGLWALWRQWRARRGLASIAAIAVLLVAIALLPTVIAAASYAAIGHFDDWWFANARSIFGRNVDPAAERYGNLAGLVAILSPLVSAAVIGLFVPDAWRTPARLFLIGWLAVSLVTLLAFGTWFDHYGLRSMLPACVCASAAIGQQAAIKRWAPWMVLVAAIGGEGLLVSKLFGRGTPAQFDQLVAAIGTGPGCLFIYSGEPMLYPASGRCTLTRYRFPSHLTRTREAGAIGVDQASELARIIAQRPTVVVIGPPFRGEQPALRRAVLRQMGRDYRLHDAVPLGRWTLAVYNRRDLPATGAPGIR